MFLVVATSMFPVIILVVPLLKLFTGGFDWWPWSWINTYQGILLPTLFMSFGIFFLRQHIEAIERLESEKTGIGDDIKDRYSALKAEGMRVGDRFLFEPRLEREEPEPCRGCVARSACETGSAESSAAMSWLELGLIDGEGRPTRRGRIFSYFQNALSDLKPLQ